MKTTRSSYDTHQHPTVRAQAQLIERAEWKRMLDARSAKREARHQLAREQQARRTARRSVPRNGAQWGAVSYVVQAALAVGAAVAMLFGRFI